KKDRRKSPHKTDRATRGKGPADISDEPPALRQRPKSMRELCSARDPSAPRAPRPEGGGGDPDAVAAAEVRATEAQSLVELDEANGRQALVEADLEKARLESAILESQLVDLRERLDDSEGQLRCARAQVREMETELLDLARYKEALREDLPKRAIGK
ncbi:hypothetical protein BHE74_00011982, partial [Ensete ventricosum]